MLSHNQCFFFSRNMGQVTPIKNVFSLSKKIFSGSKYPKNIVFNFENRCTAHISLLRPGPPGREEAVCGLFAGHEPPAAAGTLTSSDSFLEINKYLAGYPKKSWFLLLTVRFVRSKYPRNMLLYFENKRTALILNAACLYHTMEQISW